MINDVENVVDSFRREFVADERGRLRQAGTVDPRQQSIDQLKEACEISLYIFCVFVLGRHYLTPTLHRPLCNWMAAGSHFRKMLLLPRAHAKTSIVSHGLPLHLIIQPKGGIYMPKKPGSEMRILMVGETEGRAVNNLRVVRNVLESNQIFRGFWPHLIWDNPNRDSARWNEKGLLLPRQENYPDVTFSASGVGSAITGARLDAIIKDDLIARDAANSPAVMETAIVWQQESRALFDDQTQSLEYVIGTRWAVHDLYSWIIDNDDTVDYVIRSIVEDGKPIYPEVYDMETIEKMKISFGTMFYLLYMNSVGDSALVDFDMDLLRLYSMDSEGNIEFAYDHRDDAMEALLESMTSVRNDVYTEEDSVFDVIPFTRYRSV